MDNDSKGSDAVAISLILGDHSGVSHSLFLFLQMKNATIQLSNRNRTGIQVYQELRLRSGQPSIGRQANNVTPDSAHDGGTAVIHKGSAEAGRRRAENSWPLALSIAGHEPILHRPS